MADADLDALPSLEALLSGRCTYCGRPAEGNYAVHRDDFGEGPEVPLCDACGGGERPTLEEIWNRISETRNWMPPGGTS